MHLIIWELSFDYLEIMRDYIIYYLSPPLGDNRDNVCAFFGPKKGSPHIWKTPPSKILDPLFFRGHPSWKA